MDNYGFKRGYNNSSGWIYTNQGNTNLDCFTKDCIAVLPTWTTSRPYYENEANTKAFFEYSGKPVKGSMKFDKNNSPNTRIRLPPKALKLPLKGGDETNSDFQTI